eukprot:2253410-Rhodomonas_salina.1
MLNKEGWGMQVALQRKANIKLDFTAPEEVAAYLALLDGACLALLETTLKSDVGRVERHTRSEGGRCGGWHDTCVGK